MNKERFVAIGFFCLVAIVSLAVFGNSQALTYNSSVNNREIIPSTMTATNCIRVPANGTTFQAGCGQTSSQWGSTQISTLTANGSITMGGGAVIQSSGTGAPILTASDGIEQTRNANLVFAHQTNRNRGTCLIGGMWSDSSIQGNQAEACVTGDLNVDPGSVQFYTGNISTGRVVFALGTGAARPEKVWMFNEGVYFGTHTKITAGNFTIGAATAAASIDGTDLRGNAPNIEINGANPRLYLQGTGDAGISLIDGGSGAGNRTFNITNNAALINIQALDASQSEKYVFLKLDLANGGVEISPRTIAQLVATTPRVAGQTFYCSDCTLAGGRNVVSTGTSAGNFADADGSDWE